ncbi:hypothetical protein L218DRAFT_951038 [Marasmius fiardii PR-910]|nr:hypothetical protein L218DRAFT_951038 [Marasmius fiardii PR-910]
MPRPVEIGPKNLRGQNHTQQLPVLLLFRKSVDCQIPDNTTLSIVEAPFVRTSQLDCFCPTTYHESKKVKEKIQFDVKPAHVPLRLPSLRTKYNVLENWENNLLDPSLTVWVFTESSTIGNVIIATVRLRLAPLVGSYGTWRIMRKSITVFHPTCETKSKSLRH